MSIFTRLVLILLLSSCASQTISEPSPIAAQQQPKGNPWDGFNVFSLLSLLPH